MVMELWIGVTIARKLNIGNGIAQFTPKLKVIENLIKPKQ